MNGHEDRPDETHLITLDPEGFSAVVRRVHEFLVHRAEKAVVKKEAHPTKRSMSNYIETSKDLFVFTHMMEMIEHMSQEISELREIVSQVGEKVSLEVPEGFTGVGKKNMLN